MMSTTDANVENAYAFLRGHFTADLRFDENVRPMKYVVGPDGKLIVPVMVAMLRSVDTVLFVPGYVDDAMELQVTLEGFEESGPDGMAADRWRIYHGEPPDVRWAFLRIDAARFGGFVIDGDALMRPNPMVREEPWLCKLMNTQKMDDLRRLCSHYGKMDVENPVMVGVDPLGFDVRARFDVVRVPALEPISTREQARIMLRDMAQAAV